MPRVGSVRITRSSERARMGVPAARRRTIYYGADADRFQPSRAVPERARAELGIPPGAPLIGNVAYFYPPLVGPLAPRHLRGRAIKGHEDLIAAAVLVLAERPDARFVFVGDGWGPEGKQYRRQLEEWTRELGLADKVAFVGHRGDVADLLGGLDVSVQCSLSESLGGTIESLLMERPTIATRVGGMPEAVIHEETGLTVPPRDPRALADAVLRLLRYPDEAREFGQQGRALMLERFTLARTVAEIDALYAELAHERRSPVAHPATLRERPTR